MRPGERGAFLHAGWTSVGVLDLDPSTSDPVPSAEERQTVRILDRDRDPVSGKPTNRCAAGPGRQPQLARFRPDLGRQPLVGRLVRHASGSLDLTGKRAVVDLRPHELDRPVGDKNLDDDPAQTTGAAGSLLGGRDPTRPTSRPLDQATTAIARRRRSVAPDSRARRWYPALLFLSPVHTPPPPSNPDCPI